MQKKLIYIISILVILTGIIGPAIYANKVNNNNQAAETSKSGTVSRISEERTIPVNETAKNEEQKAETKSVSDMPIQSTGEIDKSSVDQKIKNSNSPITASQDSAVTVQEPTVSSPAKNVQEVGCTVGIAVVGKDGELLYAPGDVTLTPKNIWDVTALGALDATALSYTMSNGFSGFVEAVDGCRNKGQSGWMYMVNGEMPKVAANQKTVKAGDKVIWWYSKSMDSPQPDWEDLSKHR